MNFIKSLLSAAKRFAAKVVQATAPQQTPLRLNPAVAFKPQRDIVTGPQLRWLKTRKHNGITYRAGRSKYAPQELKDACERARARQHGAGGYVSSAPYRSPAKAMQRITEWLKTQPNRPQAPAPA